MYGALKGISDKLIRKFGQSCEAQGATQGQYDVATGKVSASNNIAHAGFCLFDNTALRFQSNLPAGVEQGDSVLYLTASTNPQTGGTVRVGGETWTLLDVQPLKPAQTVLLYQCIGRKADG